MISIETFYGEDIELSTAASFAIVPTLARLWQVTATVGSLAGTLPSARSMRKGGPSALILNAGSNAFAIKDKTGATIIASLAAGKLAELTLLSNSTTAGVWCWHIWTGI